MLFNYENDILRIIQDKQRFDVIGKISLNIWEDIKTPKFFIEDLRVI